MPQITAVNNTIKDTVIGEEEIDQLLSAGVLLSMEDDLAKANSGQLVTESRKIPLADFKLEEKKIEVSKKIEPTNVVPLKTVAPPLKTQAEEILLKQKELAKEKENKIEMTRIEAQKREKEQEADRAIVEDIREKIEAQKQAQATPVILKPSVILKNDETSIQDIRQKAQEEEQKKIEQQKALMLEIRSKAEAERKAKEEELVYLKAQQEKRQEELKQTEKIKVGEIKKQAMPNQSGDIRRKLEQEQEVLTLQLRAFPARKKPVEERLSALKKQKEDLIKVLANLVNRETVQSNKRREIENQEKITTNSDERHKLEKERWLVEENLRQVEKEKWEPGAKLGVLQEKISEIEAELLGFNGVEMELRKKVEEIVWKIKEINLAVEKSRLVKMLEVFDQELSGLNKEKNVYFQTKNELEVKIQEITQKEKDIEDQVNQLEEREKTAVTPEQEKSLEQERWHSDGLRQKIEQERWIEESKRNDFETKIKDVDNRVKGIEDKIYKSKSRIAEIESFLINQGKLTVVQEFKKPEVTKVAQAIQMVKPAIITPPPVMAPVLKPQESIIKAEVKPLGLAPQEAISDEAGIGERKQKEQ
ncbi:MAG: hypothetical protein NTV62_03505, partial [Candidatus Gribaldobacteria bacterium]|nr:hypothetical protein [Candidatus Gribaldobacteria bacterium]